MASVSQANGPSVLPSGVMARKPTDGSSSIAVNPTSAGRSWRSRSVRPSTQASAP